MLLDVALFFLASDLVSVAWYTHVPHATGSFSLGHGIVIAGTESTRESGIAEGPPPVST